MLFINKIITTYQEKSNKVNYLKITFTLGLSYFEEQNRGHIILPMSTSNHG